MRSAKAANGSGARILTAILSGGVVAATLDFVAATLIYHAPVKAVAKAVASGWVGHAAAKAGGAQIVALGIASHYAILIVAAAIFVLVSLRFAVLRRGALLTGPLFGVCIYAVMHLVVVPLSRAGSNTPHGVQFVEEFLGHMFLIGLPIALLARRSLGPK